MCSSPSSGEPDARGKLRMRWRGGGNRPMSTLQTRKVARELHPGQPASFEEVEEQLCELLTLERNWDSYGALPIDPANVAAARRLLKRLEPWRPVPPYVVPTVGGAVQFEWHLRGV